MANYIRVRKCDLRSGPQFGLWFWRITLQWLITLPCILSRCQGFDSLSLAVQPEGTVKVLHGQEPVELYCQDNRSTSNNLEFAIDGNPVSSTRVNTTTIKLFMENHKKGVFVYYCRNKITRKVCPTRVLVDSAPLDVTGFACRSKNLDILNCTWVVNPKSYTVTNFSLILLVENSDHSVSVCNGTHSDEIRYCSWNISGSPRYRQLDKQFFFNLKFCNVFGCNEQNFTIDHFSIVKPDPPSELKVLGNGTHSVLLQWNIPNNMIDLLPNGVDHKIEYQIAKIDNTSYFRAVNTSGLPSRNKTYKFLLSDLPYAHMQYDLRIYIKTKEAFKDEFWSDFTYLVFNTASERPKRPPDTVVGAFDQNPYVTTRRINVYWKQLEEYEEAGANFSYKVVIRQDTGNPKTILADNKKSLSYIVLEDASLGAIDVDITSINEKGSSHNKSHLYIPPKADTAALKIPSFTKLAYENGTYKLSWAGKENIDNYTVFWCPLNATKICAGRMSFTVLDPNKTSHVIDLPKENRYQFAISANNGTKTSGMVWATCDISKDGIPMYRFPVELKHGVPGKTFVQIKWTMPCTLQEGIVTGYNIIYCPVKNTSAICDPSFAESTVNISNPNQMEVNITDLKPYRTYQFKIGLDTTYGLKPIENASTGVTTTEDTPTSAINVKITEVESDSAVISWDPPLDKNGIMRQYKIYNDTEEYASYKVLEGDKDSVRRSFKLKGLDGFSNYSWSVVACNSAVKSCSQKSPPNGIFLRTRIGPPSKLKPPIINNSPDEITWEKPEKPGGTVDMYQILRVKDDQEEEIFNTTNLFYSLVNCAGGVAVEKYKVRAVNYDEDTNHGVIVDTITDLPKHDGRLEFPGEWSDFSQLACRSRDGLTMTFILMAVLALVAIMYGSIKLYKRYRKMEDIKPVLPNGLGIPEKDVSKYAFGGWNPTSKDEKPPSDEMLLLPNSRTTVSTDIKQKDESNCGASDHTDSTVLSETSRGPVDRQASTSDEGSDSSLRLEIEPVTADGSDAPRDEDDCSGSDTEVSNESSPYFSNEGVKKNPTNGYVQQPVVNPATGYVQSAPTLAKGPPESAPTQPASSSYVMAALSPPIFTTGVAPPSLQRNPPPSSGYVRPEDAQVKSMLNFPNHKSSPTKTFGPESLPIMPTLPPPTKHGAESSYIQLQSLPSHKQSVQNVPLKPPASSGYVSPGDAVINKHLNNMLSASQLAEESAILDPMMSPNAYCRFSWSTDPANDNLHSLLANSPTSKTTKN